MKDKRRFTQTHVGPPYVIAELLVCIWLDFFLNSRWTTNRSTKSKQTGLWFSNTDWNISFWTKL